MIADFALRGKAFVQFCTLVRPPRAVIYCSCRGTLSVTQVVYEKEGKVTMAPSKKCFSFMELPLFYIYLINQRSVLLEPLLNLVQS